MYVFGGYTSLAAVSDRVRVFDLASEAWQASLPAPPDMPQSHCAVATDACRFVYLVSGQLGPECSPAVRDAFVFDTRTGQWHSLPPLPEPRYAGTMQLWRGRLHYIGGAREDRWTPSDDHWSLGVRDGAAIDAQWRRERPIPLAGMHRGSILHGDALLVFGGQQGDFTAIPGDPACTCTGRTQETYLAGCFRLDAPDGEWTRLADLPVPASHTDFSIHAVEGRILVVGGQISKDPVSFRLRLTDAIQAYDVDADRWSIAGHLPYRLKIPLVTVWNDRLYVFAGQRGEGQGDRPGAVSAEVWAAPLHGLREDVVSCRSEVFGGRTVLLISHCLSVSGAPLLLVETARRLMEAGACVRLASVADDTTGWTIAARLGLPVIPIESALQHARSSDVVIANTVSREVMTWVSHALEADASLAARLVCWVHEIDVEHFLPEAGAMRRAALRIFDSQACLDAWTATLGPLPGSRVVHPCVSDAFVQGVSADRLPFPTRPHRRAASDLVPATRHEVRRRLGLGDDDFLVVCIAMMEERKGQMLLLRTLSDLAAVRKLPVKLLLVGLRDWRKRLKFLLGRTSRERRVLSAARTYVWQHEITAFYRAADACVTNTQGRSAQRGECFGRVTVEAMAAGCVTLGTDAGGTPDIILDGETGFLYPVGPEGQALLAARIETLVRDRARAAALGAAGRARAATDFSEARFFEGFEDSLRPLLCRPPASRVDHGARMAEDRDRHWSAG